MEAQSINCAGGQILGPGQAACSLLKVRIPPTGIMPFDAKAILRFSRFKEDLCCP